MAAKNTALVVDILHDIQQHLFTYILLLAVIGSAFAVIYFTHLNRQTTSELEMLLTVRDEIEIERRNLVIEQNSLAEHSTIEKKAAELLNMNRPDTESEIVITIP
ncbi:cell division protein FtsL [Colwellia sp. MEBiC06753]